MSGFENFGRDAAELDERLLALGVALGVDWEDADAVRRLAMEALDGAGHVQALLRDPAPEKRARGELFALTVLMQKLLEESAETGVTTEVGPVWKAFSRALAMAQGASRADGQSDGQ